MAHAHSNSKNNRATAAISAGGESEVKPTTFHDFLGDKGQPQDSAPPPAGGVRPAPDVSPSATSDLGSVMLERHVSNHLEGIPFYGSRGDVVGPENSNRFMNNKRSNSDSFMMSSRDKFPQGPTDSPDSQVLTKLLRYSGGERPKRPHDEEASFGMHQMRPLSASFISQTSTGGGRTDNNPSKWDRATTLNSGPAMQYPPRTGQVMPFGYHAHSNRFKETNIGPSLMSQTAADEGSRTGIKGSGLLSSLNAAGAISGRQPAGVLIRSGKSKSGTCISEPESSTMPSRRGTESAGRQMTIFYGGQAHVFDNVHPNKADVIMALAGSNGGSWSTTYTPNSAVRPSTGENRLPSSNSDVGIAMLRELHGGPSDKGDTHRGFASAD
ncbi:protein TIFY 8-like [Salvia splendens]|uniref:protein TIFY 8-like n=1 Tax=Salvia splendens TaxID=180675 RepID=UPI001C25383C|nr:protein TIFY 8-like [Salvia splendens]